MTEISIAQASVLTSPNPLMLVCTQAPDGITNLAPVSWWTYLSFRPGIVGFAMSKASYSGELMRQTGHVVLAVPSSELSKEVKACGSVSGRNAKKAEQFSISLKCVPSTSIQIPEHTRLALFCQLENTIEAGDHILYICSVKNTYGDPSKKALFAWNGYSDLRPVESL